MNDVSGQEPLGPAAPAEANPNAMLRSNRHNLSQEETNPMAVNSAAPNDLLRRHPSAGGQPVSVLGWTMAIVAGLLIWWLLFALVV